MNTIAIHKANKDADATASQSNANAINAKNPWINTIDEIAFSIANENSSAKSKMAKLLKLGTRLSNSIGEHSACAGNGCSFCCHQAVMITDLEAERIRALTNRDYKLSFPPYKPREDVKRFYGVPCIFLRENSCSIYSERPLACRVSNNIGASPFFCNSEIPASESEVHSISVDGVWDSYFHVAKSANARLGDIREFFPEP